VARSQDRLVSLAAQLRAEHRVRVDIVRIDLAQADAVTRLEAQIDALGHGVDILINSAGFCAGSSSLSRTSGGTLRFKPRQRTGRPPDRAAKRQGVSGSRPPARQDTNRRSTS
jgi:NAD(P)-dependent dehydrogenase (short-subunit alcohol dehydrogenase family)